MAVLLALVTIALYWPATGHDFINFDDNVYVLENAQVTSGLNLESLQWAFFKPEVGFGYWHPLTLLSHMVDCQLFGLQPWGHHLTSVLLHAVNTVLVFLLLRSLTGTTRRSLLVAALFGCHPLHVESVAWVAERKDVLSTCFGFLALLFYARWARGRIEKEREQDRGGFCSPRSALTSGSYWPAFVFYLLGLLSKPMLVTWPFVMLLLDYWPLGRFSPKSKVQSPKSRTAEGEITLHAPRSTLHGLILEKLPFFALAAAASVVTFVMSKHGGALSAGETLPLAARSGNALISYCRYLGKLFWPTNLAVFYPHPGHWPLAKVLLAGGLILGISGLLFAQRRRFPFSMMGWLWYCGTLVPAIGLVQVGGFAMADRYAYIPSLGILILTVWGAYELSRHRRPAVIGLSAGWAAAVILCMALTRQQLGHWKDSEALFRHALEVTENNCLAHNNLGNALDQKGQTDEAISQFHEAIRLKPDQAEARYNLGMALVRKGHAEEAISQYQEAIRLKPDYVRAHNNLGIELAKQGQIDEAIRQFQETIRLKPDYVDAHNNLGNVFAKRRQLSEAILQFQEAVRLKPDAAFSHNYLGMALAENGQIDEAMGQFQEALRLKPDYAQARNNLTRALGIKSVPEGR
jgi:Tfp pilus assembly protein PilF